MSDEKPTTELLSSTTVTEDEVKDEAPAGKETEYYYEAELDPQRKITNTGYPFLDQVEREKAEIARAKVEGRKPDLENPGPSTGSPLRSLEQLDHPLNYNQAAVAKDPGTKPALVVTEDSE